MDNVERFLFFFLLFFLFLGEDHRIGICFVSQCIHFIPIVMDCETQQCYNLMCAVVPLFRSARREKFLISGRDFFIFLSSKKI